MVPVVLSLQYIPLLTTRGRQPHARRSTRGLLFTWAEGDHRAGLPLDLDPNPVVDLLYPGAAGAPLPGLGTAAGPVAGHPLRPTGPGAGGPLGPLAPVPGHWDRETTFP